MPALILCYHTISGSGKITPDIFEKNLVALEKNGYSAVTLDEIHEYVLGRKQLPWKSVHLTFDDGYRDN